MQCIASAVCRASWSLGWRRCEANGGTPRLCAPPFGGDRRNGAHGKQPRGDLGLGTGTWSVQAIYAGGATTPPAMRPRLGRWPGRIAVACTGGAGLSWHAAAVPGTPCRQLGRAAAGRAIKAPAVPPSSVSLRCWSLYFEHLQRQRWKGDPPGPSFCAAIGFQYLRNSIRMPFTELYCIPVQILCLNVSDENLVSPVRAF